MAIILSSSSLWHFPKYSPYVKTNANHFISLTQCLLRHHVTGSTIVIIFWRGHRMKETHLSFWLDTVSSSYSWQPEDCVSASYFINVSIFLSDLFLALGIKGRLSTFLMNILLLSYWKEFLSMFTIGDSLNSIVNIFHKKIIIQMLF